MDKTMIYRPDATPGRREGFAGQVLHVIAAPILARARRDPLFGRLHPTDVGDYPAAQHHYVERPDGAAEHVLILCRAGAGWVESTAGRRHLGAGQLVWLVAGGAHAYGASLEDPWSIHWLHLAGEDAPAALEPLGPPGEPRALDPILTDRLAGLFAEMLEALARAHHHDCLVLASQVARHLLARARMTGPSTEEASVGGGPLGAIDRVVAWIQEDPARRVSVGELARRAHLSPPHFAVVFRRRTGFSPRAYLIHLRIRRACALLDQTDLGVAAIGARVGYDDPYYFSRLFRRMMGASPRAYRNRAK